jgi:hypothetical protein
LELRLTESNLPPKQSNTTVAAKIIKVFEPVTMSPVMRVQSDGEREPAVLKLYDRRFGPPMRKIRAYLPGTQSASGYITSLSKAVGRTGSYHT